MFSAQDEQAVAILSEIAAKNSGKLTPDALVSAATDPDHPWHDRFEWDDSKAAHEHRLEQARTLIRSVKVVITTDTRTIQTVFYTRDPQAAPDEQGYVSLPQLRSDTELAHEALINEFSRASTVLTRARNLAAALSMEPEVDKLIEQVKRVKQIAAERVTQ